MISSVLTLSDARVRVQSLKTTAFLTTPLFQTFVPKLI